MLQNLTVTKKKVFALNQKTSIAKNTYKIIAKGVLYDLETEAVVYHPTYDIPMAELYRKPSLGGKYGEASVYNISFLLHPFNEDGDYAKFILE